MGASHEWQPFETAPKTGEWFLAIWAQTGRPVYAVVAWRGGFWVEASEEVGPFTHWMSLPQPPQGEQ